MIRVGVRVRIFEIYSENSFLQYTIKIVFLIVTEDGIAVILVFSDLCYLLDISLCENLATLPRPSFHHHLAFLYFSYTASTLIR